MGVGLKTYVVVVVIVDVVVVVIVVVVVVVAAFDSFSHWKPDSTKDSVLLW